MLIFIGKLVFLFIFLVIIIRFLGKSVLAQLTPHDFMTIVFLSYLSFQPLKVDGIMETIVGIIVISIVHVLISRLSLLQWLNKFIIGQPTILIKHGKIIKSNLKNSRYSLNELLSAIRSAGYPYIQNIEYAILEPNGQLSILPKPDMIAITPKLLNIKTEYEGLPIAVVIEGKIKHKNLSLINKTEQWLINELKLKGFCNLDDIFYAAVNDTDYSLIVDTGK
ncbi:DUF421 domain-containing protein [Tepidibacter formicigenes]|jgi:uncharacterized membrane protein YcaP (DUF421 family)|uniref:Uncharacterized membrane protein YcaP, DUF421 family n=1 Tax=Tepidibacter formicigenes DSM 15518 TaxID=1123349 RepID=A0A1M6Q5M6_9FIRM|nr:DUF421 domain-containing protein [Tepidibacter formicigenes]SHK15485.1 Uncharacterized membrane protein YcaP, DUF421 family [Tepidibacter formicigenes DSM 15518]